MIIHRNCVKTFDFRFIFKTVMIDCKTILVSLLLSLFLSPSHSSIIGRLPLSAVRRPGTVRMVPVKEVLDEDYNDEEYNDTVEMDKQNARPMYPHKDKVGLKCIFDRFKLSIIQRYDKWGYGFGSDGYLYDFVKRSQDKRARNYDVWGFGSDGYLYDFVRR